MRKLLRACLITLLAATACLNVLKAEMAELFPIEDIKPNMRGKTYTVMQGTEIVPLETEVLGVLKNGLGPGKDLIIGRLLDEKTKLTGAVHGMSGSPLYINGKLVGALSRRLMNFEKDGHCGFTPIRDMLDVQNRGRGKKEDKVGASPFLAFWPQGATSGFISAALSSKPDSGHWLTVPLSMSGWSEGMLNSMQPLFKGLTGFMPLATTSGAGVTSKSIKIEPGSALSVLLIDGDLRAGGTGTATTVDGNKVTAFGHPMMGMGPTSLPMASAEIITTLPSYSVPHKIANIGQACGTIWQDRLSAIAGELGPTPVMASYEVKRKHDNNVRPTLKGTFVKEEWVAPQLMAMLMARAIMDEQDFSEDATIRLNGEIKFKGLPSYQIRGLYSGASDQRMQSLFDQLNPLMNLYQRFPKQVEVESLVLTVVSFESASQWKLETLNVRDRKLSKGQSVQAILRFKNGLGLVRVEEAELTVPEELKNTGFRLRAISGAQLQTLEQAFKNSAGVGTASDYLNSLSRTYSSDALYLQIVTNEPSVVSRNSLQLGLPFSVVETMNDSNHEAVRLTSAAKVWIEKKIQLPGVVTGSADTGMEIE